MVPVERIGLVVHGGKEVALAAAREVRRWAAAHDIPCADIDVWDDVHGHRLNAREEAARAGSPDLIVTVGGDGTFLRGVRVAGPTGALVLGVNVGRVGFLTEVSTNDLTNALDAVHRGEMTVDARMTLTMRASRPLEIPDGMEAMLRYGRGPMLPPPHVRPGMNSAAGWGVPLDVLALNDIVAEKLARDRQASLAVYVGGKLFASYSADALIVASSTGSTAYSFAAGGPIVSPHLDALVFTPVAAHMVFNRSVVLDSSQRVGILVLEHSGQVAVSVDGQLRGVLDPGDWITVYGAPKRSKLVRLSEPDFLGKVRDRFGLVDSAAALADGRPPAYAPNEPVPPDLAHPGPAEGD
ncbi:NAD(+)/NADH kinase [Amycolatopsis acidiphila]|uniref:NAD kinase n=1 Tax=Amycolatopsis acidiphila TaxID=715473 RepID=A0A557ZXZ1_9PSEU|nr:NAD(+)/NADH kinase [Amycolatopsis acidiphila]TVT16870.1 NAD(+)/NADH kinase [Amycolatopsis acidiphila]UIJ58717.1 NAD(+)/NADH kinase [Amycolatopsis acidiphila]GHG75856.1 NAD kinase 1 [Amycolatopsis acidiphila]